MHFQGGHHRYRQYQQPDRCHGHGVGLRAPAETKADGLCGRYHPLCQLRGRDRAGRHPLYRPRCGIDRKGTGAFQASISKADVGADGRGTLFQSGKRL